MHRIAPLAVLVLLALAPTAAQAQPGGAIGHALQAGADPAAARRIALDFLSDKPIAPVPDLTREEVEHAATTLHFDRRVGRVVVVRGPRFGVAVDLVRDQAVAFWTCDGCLPWADLAHYVAGQGLHTCSRPWPGLRHDEHRALVAGRHARRLRLSPWETWVRSLEATDWDTTPWSAVARLEADGELLRPRVFWVERGRALSMVLDPSSLLPTAARLPLGSGLHFSLYPPLDDSAPDVDQPVVIMVPSEYQRPRLPPLPVPGPGTQITPEEAVRHARSTACALPWKGYDPTAEARLEWVVGDLLHGPLYEVELGRLVIYISALDGRVVEVSTEARSTNGDPDPELRTVEWLEEHRSVDHEQLTELLIAWVGERPTAVDTARGLRARVHAEFTAEGRIRRAWVDAPTYAQPTDGWEGHAGVRVRTLEWLQARDSLAQVTLRHIRYAYFRDPHSGAPRSGLLLTGIAAYSRASGHGCGRCVGGFQREEDFHFIAVLTQEDELLIQANGPRGVVFRKPLEEWVAERDGLSHD
jgi:hypothetical protein